MALSVRLTTGGIKIIVLYSMKNALAKSIGLLIFFCFSIVQLEAQKFNPDQFQNLKIRNVGPANMSGRITAIDVVQSNNKIIYIGAASGGVW